MDELTIEQTKEILGWSYPTALYFAKMHGRKDGLKWVVPVAAVDGVIAERQREVVEAVERMRHYCPEYNLVVYNVTRPECLPETANAS
jgi:hypothetical protein